MEVYVYQPLDVSRQEIRVVQILSPTDCGRETLRISLKHIDLHDQPCYETISYTWGDPEPLSQLLLDGKSFMVPKNTEAVLRRLVTINDRRRVFWIDSVCINQADAKERARQVSMMGMIYSRCALNIVYLGAEHPLAERALSTIRALRGEVLYAMHAGPEQKRVMRQSPPRTKIDMEALVAFYERPYFSRLWVTQEATLARHNLCIWGALEMNFNEVLECSAFLYQLHQLNLAKTFDFLRGLNAASSIYELSFCLDDGTPILLAETLARRRDLATSDDRDRVFAVLGMTHLYRRVPVALAPDYNKSYRDVMRDAIRYCIEVERSLSVLKGVAHRTENIASDSFPTWVPHYERAFDCNCDPYTLPFRTWPKPPDISGEEVDTRETESPDILSLNGYVVCKVQKLSPVFFSRGVPRRSDSFTRWPTYIKSIETIMSFVEDQSQGNMIRLWRTVNVDRREQRNPSSSDMAQMLLITLGIVRALNDGADISVLPIRSLEMGKECMDGIERGCPQRRLIMTDNQFIGLAPKFVERGDIVIVTEMDRMLLVVRPVDDQHYLLLGECYIDDMRDDELIQRFLENKEKVEFKIR